MSRRFSSRKQCHSRDCHVQHWYFLGSSLEGFLIRHQSLAHTPLYGFLMVMLVAIVTLLWLLFDNKK